LNGSRTNNPREIFVERNIENVTVLFSNNPWYRNKKQFQSLEKLPAKNISLEAKKYLGVPYKYGGSNPSEGFDCSGLVQYVFGKYGKNLPRSTREQFKIGKNVPPQWAKPGDLIFFDIDGKGISHVGIYMGNMRFIHAPHTNSQVKIVTLLSDYWKKKFRGIKRIAI
jgi:cell wall-associated NlpC family hydrolase